MSRRFATELDYEAADAIVIEALRRSLDNVLETCDWLNLSEDQVAYAEQYKAAVNFVLEHFGGEPVKNKN
jgi:hypothetical protein